jgi:5-methylcytosine-specific restriction endonuclease McrA
LPGGGDWEASGAGGERDVALSLDAALSLDVAQSYLMQFTTSREHAELVERAQALLSHRSPPVSLGELHLRAMRFLVKWLEKERFGSEKALANLGQTETKPEPAGAQRERASVEREAPCHQAAAAKTPRRRGRYVSARVRRAVYERDGGCCAYVDGRGVRCGESHHLEVHHLHAFALGGEHELHNLSLRCQAHNALAAEQDFGREHREHQREGGRHDSER